MPALRGVPQVTHSNLAILHVQVVNDISKSLHSTFPVIHIVNWYDCITLLTFSYQLHPCYQGGRNDVAGRPHTSSVDSYQH